MTIKIREADERDFEQIVELFTEFSVFEKHPEKMDNSVERMRTEKDYFHCYIAETTGEKIVGYVSYFFCYYTWTGKSIYMDDLYIKPEYRGKGTGSLLIQKVIDLGKETKCRKLRWQVSHWNQPAIDFYKSLGAEIDNNEQNCDLILN